MNYKESSIFPVQNTNDLLKEVLDDQKKEESFQDELVNSFTSLMDKFNYLKASNEPLFTLLMNVKNNIMIDIDNNMLLEKFFDDESTTNQRIIIMCIFIIEIERKTKEFVEIDAVIEMLDIGMDIAPDIYTNMLLHLSNEAEIRFGVEVLEKLSNDDLVYNAKTNVLNIIINSIDTTDEKRFSESLRTIYENEKIHSFIIDNIDVDDAKFLYLAMLSIDLPRENKEEEMEIIKHIDFD